MAQYPWKPDLTSREFYTDFCASDFGLAAADAAKCAALFDDGKIDVTCKRGTVPSCRGTPTRPPMQGLPAAVKADSSSWASQKPRYAFVDAVAEALDGKISGAENRDRWLYWLSMLKSLQADAQFATTWGAFNAAMVLAAKEPDLDKRKQLAQQKCLPLRLQLVAEAETAILWKMNTTSTTGGLGAVANFNQFVLTNALAVHDCTKQAATQGCFNNTRLLQEYLAGVGGNDSSSSKTLAPLPAAAMPTASFRGVERGFVLSPRSSVEKGMLLKVTYIALLTDASVKTAKATLHYRTMGATSKYNETSMTAVRSVFTATLGASATASDFEYFVSTSGTARALVWPAGAPAAPHTVIAV